MITIKNTNGTTLYVVDEATTAKEALQKLVEIGCNLHRANLSNANLYGADLHYADLRNADLSDADLSDADLSDANLSGADLSSAYLHGANLHYANLYGANLYGANLRNADLRDADLSDADLSDADLSGAKLSGAKFDLSDAADRGADTAYRFVANFYNKNGVKIGHLEFDLPKECEHWTDIANAMIERHGNFVASCDPSFVTILDCDDKSEHLLKISPLT